MKEEHSLTEFGSSFQPEKSESVSDDQSMNTAQHNIALEQQLVKYEADIRRHISIEHQLQLFADDLKRSITTLEKEKEQLERQTVI